MKKVLMSVIFFGAVSGFASTVMADNGAELFKAKCLVCHGVEGRGTALAPTFKENVFINTSTDEEITEVILKGRTGTAKTYKRFILGMPTQKLEETDVKQIVEYLKGISRVE